MKKVVFVDMSQKDFDRRGTEFEERRKMFLPDVYDLFNWYQEQNDVIAIERGYDGDTFYYAIQHPDFSTEMRVVCVDYVEQLEHNDEIYGKDK